MPPYNQKNRLVYLSFIAFFLISLTGLSQCDINTMQGPMIADPDGSYNVQIIDGEGVTGPFLAGYDTLTAFPNPIIGQPYETVIGVRIPNDTTLIYDLAGNGEPTLFEDVAIGTMSINTVEGMPDGFSWECVPGNCSWTGGEYGCIRIFSDAPVSSELTGLYQLNFLLDVEAIYSIAGFPLPIEVTIDDLLDYYVLAFGDALTCLDTDEDGVCDSDDPCPYDPSNDSDGDGICDQCGDDPDCVLDPCPGDPLNNCNDPVDTGINNDNIVQLVNDWDTDEQFAIQFIHGHISEWNVSNVTNMNSLFENETSFNEDISSWDVSNVTNMRDMFKNATTFNQDIGEWDVSSVTDMSYMFDNADSFNQPIGDWDVSSVTNMSYMFNDNIFAFSNIPTAFNQPIGDWDVSSVTNMSYMFNGANSFNQPIGDWDVSSVTNMSYMFNSANSFNQPIGDWDVSSVTDMSYMFYGSGSFNQHLFYWDVSSVTNMSYMFASNTVFNGDIGYWDITNVTNFSSMFYDNYAFNRDLYWDVSGFTNMENMFQNAFAFNGNIDSWDVSNVTSMNNMFRNAQSFNRDLNSWDVSNVIDMSSMFRGAQSFNGNISSWDVSSVTNMSYMFHDAHSFNRDISLWDVGSVIYMSYMFQYAARFNQNIGDWDVSSVIYMSSMFEEAYDFNQPLGAWNISNVSSFVNMLDYTSLSSINYDNLLDGWGLLAIESGVSMNASFHTNATYCNASAARDYLTGVWGWNIYDGGLSCNETTEPQQNSCLASIEVYSSSSYAWALYNPNNVYLGGISSTSISGNGTFTLEVDPELLVSGTYRIYRESSSSGGYFNISINGISVISNQYWYWEYDSYINIPGWGTTWWYYDNFSYDSSNYINTSGGCNDPLACNYDPVLFICDNCSYQTNPYLDCNDNCINDIDLDGLCDENEVLGCTDSLALNYNSYVVVDDGSCLYFSTCSDEFACNYNPLSDNESFEDCEYADLNSDCDGNCLEGYLDFGDGFCSEIIDDCMDPLACNYNADANTDSGLYCEDCMDVGTCSSMPNFCGNLLWVEDFGNSDIPNVDIVDLGGWGSWSWSNQGSQGMWSSLNASIESETPQNGFMIMDADFYNSCPQNEIECIDADNDLINDVWGENILNTHFTIGPIDLSAAETEELILQFYSNYRICCMSSPSNVNDLNVYVSTDGGEEFQDLNYIEGETYEVNVEKETFSQISLSGFSANTENVYFKFEWIGPHYFWMIDDISVVDACSYSCNDAISLFGCDYDFGDGDLLSDYCAESCNTCDPSSSSSCEYTATNAYCDGSCLEGYVDLGDGLGCVEVVSGCIDPTACNYQIYAIEDDGSCTYPSDCLLSDGTLNINTSFMYETLSGSGSNWELSNASLILSNETIENDGSITNNLLFGSSLENLSTLTAECYSGEVTIGLTINNDILSDSGQATIILSGEEFSITSESYLINTQTVIQDGEVIGEILSFTFSAGETGIPLELDPLCQTCSIDASNGLVTLVNTDIDNDGIDDCQELVGCMDENACNYNMNATDNGGCEYNTCAGCTDIGACNYNSLATISNDSCDYSCIGCVNPMACDYNPTATIAVDCVDFISCYGCIDETACNYDPVFVWDDGSCDYQTCAGCMDVNACNYDPMATIPAEYCNYDSCAGCTDLNACNYDPGALIDDGSCEYTYGAGDCEIAPLFISEYSATYYSPSYIEIYNPTNQEVSLSDYALAETASSPSCYGAYEYWYQLNGTIGPNDTYVVLNSGTSYISYDLYLSGLYMSGDDGIALVHGGVYNYGINSCGTYTSQYINFTVLDRVGDFNGDPGTGWSVAGTYNATYYNTLRRKCEISEGNPDWSSSAGTNETNSEWELLPGYVFDANNHTVCYEGCTDNTAFNYEPNAIGDDGSCIAVVEGCDDPQAQNYNSFVNTPDGTCEYDCETYEPDTSAFSCYWELWENSYYLLEEATPSIEEMIEYGYNCECVTEPVYGCMDENACNYSDIATLEQFMSCDYSCYGCMDINACTYDATATLNDDDYCDYSCYGCMDSVSCNYDEFASIPAACDYSCIGCTDIWACNYQGATVSSEESSCDYSCFGCTDVFSCNYNAQATQDFDGFLCEYANLNEDCNGNCLEGYLDFGEGCELIILGCIDESACNYSDIANYNDSSCVYPGCTDFTACNYDETAGCDDGSCEMPGCDIPQSANYNIDAACIDNTTCIDSGCTDENACNYNPNASEEDGSCWYADVNANCDGSCVDGFTSLELSWSGADAETSFIVTGLDGIELTNQMLTEVDGSMTQCWLTALQENCLFIDITAPEGFTWALFTPLNGNAPAITGTHEDIIFGELCVYGCMDETACNYNAAANADYGACNYPETYYDCDGICLIDVDGDGVCDELEVAGCQDEIACNYNVLATEDDGTCEFETCYGCTDPGSCNYSVNATYNDGSCWYAQQDYDCDGNCIINVDCNGQCGGTSTLDICGVCDGDDTSCFGCVDINASNFDETAVISDESCQYSCEYLISLGAENNINTVESSNYWCNEYVNNWGYSIEEMIEYGYNCECVTEPILGCMDEAACNYNPEATIDVLCFYEAEGLDCDGNCLDGSIMDCLGQCGGNAVLDDCGICDNDPNNDNNTCVQDCNGDWGGLAVIDACGVCDGDSTSCYGCIYEDACNYDPEVSYDDGSCLFADGICQTCDVNGEVINNDMDNDGVCDDDEIEGCQDPSACNYFIDATEDNGSCEYLTCIGCTDDTACNYDENAIISDDSCVYPTTYLDCNEDCISDADSDGYCDELDPCPYDEENDIDGDGICANNEIYGCTYSQYCNYNPEATEDDGSCVGTNPCQCTDSTACNYNPEAIEDDGSCEYLTCAGCMYTEACNYNPEATIDDDSCVGICGLAPLFISEYASSYSGDAYIEIYNPTSEYVSLDNYAIAQTASSAQGCYEYWFPFPQGVYISPGETYVVVDDIYYGCLNAYYDEYYGGYYIYGYHFNSSMYLTGDDGVALVYGGVDQGSTYDGCGYYHDNLYTDYTVLDRIGDFNGDPGTGWSVAGTYAATAYNVLKRKCEISEGNPDWNSSAGTSENNSEWILSAANDCSSYDDGSHTICFETVAGCTDNTMWNYCPSCAFDDGSCIPFIQGCTDPYAYNYNSEANTEDNSCIPLIYGCTDETAYNYNENGYSFVCLEGISDYDPYYDYSPYNEFWCDANTFDNSLEDGYLVYVAEYYDPNYNLDINTDDGSCYWVGCTDPLAENYNELYEVLSPFYDDGSCEYSNLGCVDMTACNYNENATVDDGSCEYISEGECDCYGNVLDCLGICGGDNACFDDPWITPSYITDCNASLALTPEADITLDGQSISVGDWIGVFYTDLDGQLACGGSGVWTGEPISIVIWGDDSTTSDVKEGFSNGEVLTWMAWDNETNQMMTNVDVNYSLGSEFFSCNGLLSANVINAYSTITQEITLPQDWFIFSTYVTPENPDISSLFSSIVENTTIVKNYSGEVYWPLFGINTIGNVVDGQGYYVKMIEQDTLHIEGFKIDSDFTINMPGDWFITGYLHDFPANAEDMMLPIEDDLIILKSYNGEVYWPLFNINSLGDMQPGQGYYLKTNNAVDFNYPNLVNGRFGFDENKFISIRYNQPINTGNNMVVGIPSNIWTHTPHIGDEIVVYDQNNNIVGVAPYREDGSVITIWGDDLTTDTKDGLYIGEQFIMKLWRHNESIEEEIVVNSWQEGSGAYLINGISIVSALSQKIIQEKQLLHITDVLGREINSDSRESVVIYIYDDGSIERKYQIK